MKYFGKYNGLVTQDRDNLGQVFLPAAHPAACLSGVPHTQLHRLLKVTPEFIPHSGTVKSAALTVKEQVALGYHISLLNEDSPYF